MLHIFVAADLYGQKVNLEIPFSLRPSIMELQKTVETVFNTEAAAMRPPGQSLIPFRVSVFHLYSDAHDAAGSWDVLTSSAALTDYCQIYAIQRNVAESTNSIPSPRAPRNGFAAAAASGAAGPAVDLTSQYGGGASGMNASAAGDMSDINNSSVLHRRATSPLRPNINNSRSTMVINGLNNANNTTGLSAIAAVNNNAGNTTGGSLGATAVAEPSGNVTPVPSAVFLRAAAPANGMPSASATAANAMEMSPSPALGYSSYNNNNNNVATSMARNRYTDATSTNNSTFADQQQQHFHQQSPIDALNSQQADIAPTNVSSLITMKQKLFADPNPSIEHKIRTVFDELDTNHNRRIEQEEVRRTMGNLRLDIPDAILSDIFFRADKDRDNVLCFAEFEWFAAYYPTLVDALYFRMKEAYEERRKREVIEKKRQAVEEQLQKEAAATIAQRDMKRRLDELEASLLMHEQELKGKVIREKDCQSKLNEARKETDAQRNLRQQREGDVEVAKENEKSRHKNLVEAQKSVEGAQRKVAELESDLSRCQEKEAQLEKLLEAARKETDKSRKALQVGVDDVRKWRDHEQQQADMFAESQKEVQKTVSTVSTADQELESLLKYSAATEEQLLAAQRETALAAHRRDQQEVTLRQQHERAVDHEKTVQNISHALEKARIEHENAERDLQEYRQRRLLIDSKEKPLIDDEIRLREGRFQLEESENRFRHETASFYHMAGRPAINANNTNSPLRHSGARMPLSVAPTVSSAIANLNNTTATTINSNNIGGTTSASAAGAAVNVSTNMNALHSNSNNNNSSYMYAHAPAPLTSPSVAAGGASATPAAGNISSFYQGGRY